MAKDKEQPKGVSPKAESPNPSSKPKPVINPSNELIIKGMKNKLLRGSEKKDK